MRDEFLKVRLRLPPPSARSAPANEDNGQDDRAPAQQDDREHVFGDEGEREEIDRVSLPEDPVAGHERGEQGMAAFQKDDAVTGGGIETGGGVNGGTAFAVVPDDEVARAIRGIEHRAQAPGIDEPPLNLFHNQPLAQTPLRSGPCIYVTPVYHERPLGLFQSQPGSSTSSPTGPGIYVSHVYQGKGGQHSSFGFPPLPPRLGVGIYVTHVYEDNKRLICPAGWLLNLDTGCASTGMLRPESLFVCEFGRDFCRLACPPVRAYT